MEQFIIYSTLSNRALAYFFRSIHALCFSIIDASSRCMGKYRQVSQDYASPLKIVRPDIVS